MAFSPYGSPIILVSSASNIFTKLRRGHVPPAGALNTGGVWYSRVLRPTRHIIGHFGEGTGGV